MVKICSNTYDNEEYNDHFTQFPFELSPFQKWSIEAVVTGKHSLVTAHTGCGKTVPAEFAIKYFTSNKIKKKVIYTSPLKALSNQKLHDFRKKFPNISFGILIGDYKDNIDADVLIMTTEILKNTLFNKKLDNKLSNVNALRFDMDIENELGCVIFDEVHYISDEHRGGVWEQSMILLPKHVQMIMLSATISKPETFAKWIEDISQREVYLSSTDKRIVPLQHSMWITTHPSVIKNMKDKQHKMLFEKHMNKFYPIKITGEQYNDSNDNIFRKMKNYILKNKIFIKRRYVLNTLVKQLFDENKLPAICFIFSKKHVQLCANEIEISLFREDEKHLEKDVKSECEKILRTKLINASEYLNLPEYKNIIKLLQKGIAIHHAGIMPVFREMIEMLFEKRFIKLLFATETFAVGINMPTKTVIFTSFSKFNGNKMRHLLSHEYSQMAGRAGRRGIDTKGDIIICPNLFDLPELKDMKTITSGEPKKLLSKFKISYHLIIHILLSTKKDNFIDIVTEFSSNSMVHNDIKNYIIGLKQQKDNICEKIEKKKETMNLLKTNMSELVEYNDILVQIKTSSNKKKKRLVNQMNNMISNNKFLENDYKHYLDYLSLQNEHDSIHNNILTTENYITYNIKNTINVLHDNSYIIDNNITEKMLIANNIHETNSLVLSTLYDISRGFKDLSSKELCGFISCFTNLRLKDEHTLYSPNLYTYHSEPLLTILKKIKPVVNNFIDDENKYNIDTGADYTYHYNLIELVMKWCDSSTINQCNDVIMELKQYDIFLGEFVKAIIKINNIANELINACENINNVELMSKLKEISKMTLKYIVNENSLFV